MRRLFEHSSEETQGNWVQPLVFFGFESDVAGPILSQYFIVGSSREGTDSQEQNVENESQAEDIANGIVFGLHILDVDHLRRHVARGSTSHKEILISLSELSQSEVSNHTFPRALGPENQVFRFEIAMHDAFGVHFPQTLKDRVDDKFALMSFEFILRLDFVVELSSFQQLYDYVKGVFRFEDLVKLHAEAMVEITHNFNFFDQTLLPFILAVRRFLRKGFDSIVFTSFQLLSQVDGSEVSLADLFLGLKLFMEAALVQLSSKKFSAGLQVGLISQLVLNAFFLLLEVESWRRCCKSKLEIEVKCHGLFLLGRSLKQSFFKEDEANLAIDGLVGSAGEEELSLGGGWLRQKQRSDSFHWLKNLQYQQILFSI